MPSHGCYSFNVQPEELHPIWTRRRVPDGGHFGKVIIDADCVSVTERSINVLASLRALFPCTRVIVTKNDQLQTIHQLKKFLSSP